jgi:hypothetical protein
MSLAKDSFLKALQEETQKLTEAVADEKGAGSSRASSTFTKIFIQFR